MRDDEGERDRANRFILSYLTVANNGRVAPIAFLLV